MQLRNCATWASGSTGSELGRRWGGGRGFVVVVVAWRPASPSFPFHLGSGAQHCRFDEREETKGTRSHVRPFFTLEYATDSANGVSLSVMDFRRGDTEGEANSDQNCGRRENATGEGDQSL